MATRRRRWSTFTIGVGTPEQTFRVFVATSRPWTHIPVGGCIDTPVPPFCGQTRGALLCSGKTSTGFVADSSSTWQNISVGLLDHGVDNDTVYGEDTLTVVSPINGNLTLERQVFGQMWPGCFYMGSIGLGITPIDFKNYTHQNASFIQALNDKGLIPRESFGYTAGAPYRVPPTLPFVLGRTFLQETYVTVDWERRNFSLHQALFTDPVPKADIVTITSPQRPGIVVTTNTPTGRIKDGSLSTTTKISLAALLSFLTTVLIVSVMLMYRRRQRKQAQSEHLSARNEELYSRCGACHELYGDLPELVSSKGGVEIDTSNQLYQLSDDARIHCVGIHVHEMGGGEETRPDVQILNTNRIALRRTRSL